MLIITTVLCYFVLLMLFSKFTARRADNETFFRANRKSPWYMVAFGMVGASISGITFVSVPGMAERTDMTYLQMCLGFIVDRKSTRLNSSHANISYAVFCLKKKKN